MYQLLLILINKHITSILLPVKGNSFFRYLIYGGILFVFSCQKEISKEIPLNRPRDNNNGDLLVKTISRVATDSIVTIYYYDAAKRWTGTSTYGIWGGYSQESKFMIIRNADGIISKTVHKSPVISSYGYDSVHYLVSYEAVHSRYAYVLGYNISTDPTYLDSTVFEYDNIGRVSGKRYYMINLPFPGDTTLISRFDYRYDAKGNVSSYSMTAYNSSSVESLVTTMRYDDKSAPLRLPNGESFVTVQAGDYAVNNLTYLDSRFTNTSVYENQVENKYKYNSNNKPVSSIQTLLHDNNKKIYMEYYYQ